MLTGIAYLKKMLETLPQKPGIYQMYGQKNALLYIGKAKNIQKRVASYTQNTSLSTRIKRMVFAIHHIEIIQTRTEAEAFLLEVHLIQKHTPPYNIVFRDNKTLPRLCLEGDVWPQLKRVRSRETDPQKDYFGPFPSVQSVSLTQNTLQRIFLLRTCTDYTFKTRTRPCLQYHIKRCSAPCVGKITHHAYQKSVGQLRNVLIGKTGDTQRALTHEMNAFSQSQRYEEAAQVRNRLHALLNLQQTQELALEYDAPVDIVGVYRDHDTISVYWLFFRGGHLLGGTSLTAPFDSLLKTNTLLTDLLAQFYQKNAIPDTIITQHLSQDATDRALFEKAMCQLYKTPMMLRLPQSDTEQKLCDHADGNALGSLNMKKRQLIDTQACLEQLKNHLNDHRKINRIEVYDNSHLRGTHPYAAMIVASPEGWQKSAYRRILIPKTYNTQDDYAMMRFMLQRRVERRPWPDLMIIDGGRGHYNLARDILATCDETPPLLLAIAKGHNRGRIQETFHGPSGTLDIAPNTALYFYLERLRDEAHRFALQSHTHKRTRALVTSSFMSLPGVGTKRSHALRNTFGSIEKLRLATLTQIAHTPGISHSLAKKIYDYLKNDG